VAIAASPFIYDIIPAILCRAETRVVTIFHIIPDRKAKSFLAALRFNLARMEQRFSLIIIGWFFDTILVGNSDVQDLLRKRYSEKKIIVAHAGIDTDLIDKVKEQEPDYSTALFVGRLTQQKGIYDLVAVAEYMKHENFRILMVGDGQDKKKLQGLIDSHKLKNVEMLGFVSQDEKYQLMKKSNIFIFPSYEEGWGIAPAEAMYCGSQCIMYELPHYRSIFGDFPVYANLGDHLSLSQAVMSAYADAQRAPKDQIDFMRGYNDKEVVKLILDQLSLPSFNK
jgi:glycosyltransferase involved in cell wall biosynthesis